MIRRLDTEQADFEQQFEQLLAAGSEPDAELISTVQDIIRAVRERGDEALLDYTRQFDRREAVTIPDLEIPNETLAQAVEQIPAGLKQALQESITRIRDYHEKQKQVSWEYQDADGTTLGQQVTPLDSVGVYVPGGKAAYPSSVLMNVVPAKVAGVPEIVMVVPCPGGEMNPVVLAAASLAGVDRAFSIGGAQAVAALAYGTESVPRVDKIVGPGNIYVATAKRMVFGITGIDMIAGPSEVLIISDGGGDPDWTAMDMFAQSEHDEDASALLLCPDKDFLDRVESSINQLLPDMERAGIIEASIKNHGVMIRTRDLDEAIALANRVAPEHLELAMADPENWYRKIRHAGAIFMGHFTAEVLGDYCAGPNHVLPTARTARFSSPLGVYDFQKRSSIIQCTADSVHPLAATASTMARAEGLTAHARSAEYRLKK